MPRRPRPILPHPTDPSLALVELTQGYYAVISAVDSVAVGASCWSLFLGNGKHYGYRKRAIPGTNERQTLTLHRFIAEQANLSLADEIDHVNGNGLDCRRSNLRAATHWQNGANGKMPITNTSGIKGVTLLRSGRWGATLRVNGRKMWFGSFLTKEEAGVAVTSARALHHGQFANHGSN